MFLKKFFITCLAVSGAVLSPSAFADPFLPVPPASFLNYHVSTARGLSEEVAQDVTVRARLARHFGMSAPSVAEYVRANLVETTLSASQAGRYRVACISPSGREYFVSERLAAGTPVFALASTGQPILRLACGNPLVATLPPVVHHKPVVKARPATLAVAPKPIPAPAVMMMPATPIAERTFAPVTPLAPLPAGAVVHVAGATQSLGGRGGGFVPVLLGGAAVGILARHHGSTPPAPAIVPQAAVPEASPLLLFGLFGTALLSVQLKKRQPRS